MSIPTQKHTKSRKNIRRSAIKLKTASQSVCPKCKSQVSPHTACSFCGVYKGRQVIKIRVPKKFRKKKKRQEKKK